MCRSFLFFLATWIGLMTQIQLLKAVDIAELQKHVQANAANIVTRIGQHLGWNDNLKMYYNAFANQLFKDITKDDPIFIYELTVTQSWGQFGNRLGHYFDVVSFCKQAGIHFIAFVRTDGEEPAKMIAEAIPMYIQHPNPAPNHEQAMKNLKSILYDDWPWTNEHASTWSNLDDISKYTQSVANKMQSHFHSSGGDLPASSFDLILNDKKSYPYIPYAVILTRCSDLIRAGHFDEYGMLNFNVYLMIIPTEATEIYILAEPLNYGSEHGAKICRRLISNLADFLHAQYPNAMIGVRRGHVHHGFVQLTKAKYTICAPSTFCLWPAIANRDNEVYYQPSKLVADGKKIYIHRTFNWIALHRPHLIYRHGLVRIQPDCVDILGYPQMYSYMMSEYDEKHEEESADQITKMLMKVQPRCARPVHVDKNDAVTGLDKWDCATH